MKSCRVCKESKSVKFFGKLSAAADGLNYICKPCNSKRSIMRYNSNKDLWQERQRKRRSDNYEAVIAIERASRERRSEFQRPRKNERQIKRSRVIAERSFEISEKEVARLYASACMECGSDESPSIDHIIPLSRGGSHSIGNLTTLCRKCNSSKGSKTLVEWRKHKALASKEKGCE